MKERCVQVIQASYQTLVAGIGKRSQNNDAEGCE